MRSQSLLRPIAWSALAVGLMIFEAIFPAPRGVLWQALFDAGHVPLFGLLSILLLRISFATVRLPDRRRRLHYFLSFGSVVFLAVLTELIQVPGPRDADFGDVMRNLAGGASALLITFASDRMVWEPARGRRLLLVIPALLILALSTVSLGTTAAAYWGRDRAFPVICAFQDSWEKRFVSVREGSLTATSAPPGWSLAGSPPVAKINLLPGVYPGLLIVEPRPDWTGYDLLVLDLFSEMPDRFGLELRVDDAHHSNDYGDRFNRSIMIQSGLNQVSVPLSEVRDGPVSRKMDMEHVRGLALFADHPTRAITFYLGRIRLERH